MYNHTVNPVQEKFSQPEGGTECITIRPEIALTLEKTPLIFRLCKDCEQPN